MQFIDRPTARVIWCVLICFVVAGCYRHNLSEEDAAPDTGPDGDGDVDSDADIDADGDIVDEPDSDLFCDMPCDSDSLFDHCEVGDCAMYESREMRCCVSTPITCDSRVLLDGLVPEFEVSYRGFYDNGYRCTMRVLESYDEPTFVFELRRQGEACDEGLFRVQIIGRLSEVPLETTLPLCGSAGSRRFSVEAVGRGADFDEFETLTNEQCDAEGEFVLRRLGMETGDAYEFYLRGQLADLEWDGTPTGSTIPIEIESRGLVESEM